MRLKPQLLSVNVKEIGMFRSVFEL